MTMDKKEFGSFVSAAFWVALAIIFISCLGCATHGGPTTVINPASGQVIDVPAGNRVMIVSPSGGGYSRQTDTRLQQEIVRAGVDHHAISARERSDQCRYEADKYESELRFKSDVAREVSRGIQNFQRERSYRSRNRQEAWGEAISRSVEIKPLKLNLNRLKRR